MGFNPVDLAFGNMEALRASNERLRAENAKLREELEKWNRLAENIELPEYPVTEFHPKDLERENAKLRELVRETLMDYRQYAEKYGLPPYLSDVNEHLDARLRELGIEVDG